MYANPAYQGSGTRDNLAAAGASMVAEVNHLRRRDERMERLSMWPVDLTELLHRLFHRALALGDRSAREAAAIAGPCPAAHALEVAVAAEHECDAVSMREEQKFHRRRAAGLLR